MKFYFNCVLCLVVILILYLCINKNKKEHFVGKVTLEKKLIVILMENDISKKYKGSIKTLCNSVINNCTYDFNKEKIGKAKKVNITFDKSLKTSSKNDDCNYLVLYKKSDLKSEENNADSYKSKFYKKWCSNSKKKKDNFIVIDYDSIGNNEDLLDQIEKKFKVNIPMKGLLNLSSMNNIDTLMHMKELISNNNNSSNDLNNLYNEFISKI